ncbi:MAG TPA: hypothetical protein VGF67_01705 [Ktedonobacteraceae bacterium]|jgi:hypothetical protein
MVGTHILATEAPADQEFAATSKAQGGVERGFRFLNDPWFLASSVFVKKTERIRALSLRMVWCVLVCYLAETAQTLPDPTQKPTARPTMHWIFPCVEGIALLPLSPPFSSPTLVLCLPPVHQLIFSLLGPHAEPFSLSSR